MKKIGHFVIAVILMGITALLCLFVLSVLTYWLKWQANTASVGITLIYILAGFVGGITLKRLPTKKNRDEDMVQERQFSDGITKKITEAFLAGSIFMLLLIGVSWLVLGEAFGVSLRSIVIWLLLTGSVCLGRML